MSERRGSGAMILMRMVFFGGLVVFGAVALFLGMVFLMATGIDGPIAISYSSKGKEVMETIIKADDAGRYWRLYAMMGPGPVVVGAIAAWIGVRAFRR